MEGGSAHQLHIKVVLANNSLSCLANNRKCFHQDVVKGLTSGKTLTELWGLCLQLLVGEGRHGGAKVVDVGNQALQGLDPLTITRPKDAIENFHAVSQPTRQGPADQFVPSLRTWQESTEWPNTLQMPSSLTSAASL